MKRTCAGLLILALNPAAGAEERLPADFVEGAPRLAQASPDLLAASPRWSANPLLAIAPSAPYGAYATTAPAPEDEIATIEPDDTLFSDEELLEGSPGPDEEPAARTTATTRRESPIRSRWVVEEETEVPPEAPPPVAGTGFLGFFNFGEVPAWFDAFSQNYLPYGGLSSFVVPGANRQIGPFRYGLGLTAGAAYTDNIGGSSRNRESDVIWTFTPSLYLEAGEEARVRLLYAPTFEIYTRDSGQSYVNQTLLLTWEAPIKRLNLGGGFGYTTRRGVFADSDEIATLDTYSANIYASYPIFPRTVARIEYGIGITRGEPGGNQVENVVTLSAQHALTSRISLGPYVGLGLITASANDQRYLTSGLAATYAVTDQLSLNASAGAQFRTLDDGGETFITPVAQVGAVWNPTMAVKVYGGFFRDVGINSFETSQTNVRTGGNLGVSFLLARDWTLSLDGALAYVEQIANDDDGEDSEYLFGFAEAAVAYRITSWASLRAFYNYSTRGPISNAEPFYRNTVGLSAMITF